MGKKSRRHRRVTKTKRTRRINRMKGGTLPSSGQEALLNTELDSKTRSYALSHSAMSKFLHDKLMPIASSRGSMRIIQENLESMKDKESAILSVKLANDLYENAKRAIETSFQSKNVEECRQINMRAVEQLKRAIDLGSLPARILLAGMLLSGNKVGIRLNLDEATDLIFQCVSDNADCEGLMAYKLLQTYMNTAQPFAERSAAAGSKYGQHVLSYFKHTIEKEHLLNLAANQNYDEAQIELGEICRLNGYRIVVNNEQYVNRMMPAEIVTVNRADALRLLELAAEQGNHRAFIYIGNFYKDKATELISQLFIRGATLELKNEAHDAYNKANQWFSWAEEAGNITVPFFEMRQLERKLNQFDSIYKRNQSRTQ